MRQSRCKGLHGWPSRFVQVLVATMGCPSARGDLGVAVRLVRMMVKISICIQPETHYFNGQPRTGETASNAVHHE